MHSIKTKIKLITVVAIVISMSITMLLGVIAVRKIGSSSSEQILLLLCETGEKNLDYYFESVEQTVGTVSSYAETDLEERSKDDLEAHVERVRSFFDKIAVETNGVMTYYYRIDPDYSKDVEGFWYVYVDGKG